MTHAFKIGSKDSEAIRSSLEKKAINTDVVSSAPSERATLLARETGNIRKLATKLNVDPAPTLQKASVNPGFSPAIPGGVFSVYENVV